PSAGLRLPGPPWAPVLSQPYRAPHERDPTQGLESSQTMPKWESGRGRKPASATAQNDTNQTKQEKRDDSRAVGPCAWRPIRIPPLASPYGPTQTARRVMNCQETKHMRTTPSSLKRFVADSARASAARTALRCGAREPRVQRYPFLEPGTIGGPLYRSCTGRTRGAHAGFPALGPCVSVHLERGKFAGREAGDEARGQNARDGTACMDGRRRRESAIVSAHGLSERELRVCVRTWMSACGVDVCACDGTGLVHGYAHSLRRHDF
ncbi:hypothetical protein B0H13DRAFT_2429737, partial [Mycena leptocephala]